MDTDLKTPYVSLFNDYVLFACVRIFQVFNLAIKLQKKKTKLNVREFYPIMSLAYLISFVFWFTDWFYARPYDSSRVVW